MIKNLKKQLRLNCLLTSWYFGLQFYYFVSFKININLLKYKFCWILYITFAIIIIFLSFKFIECFWNKLLQWGRLIYNYVIVYKVDQLYFILKKINSNLINRLFKFLCDCKVWWSTYFNSLCIVSKKIIK